MRSAWKLALPVVLCALVVVLCSACGSEIVNGFKNIDMDEAKELMRSTDCLIVDVRTEEEYAEGHIPGAVLLSSVDIMEGNLGDNLPDKDQTLLLYCYTGRRAEESAAKLAELGYKNVYNFGGIIDWLGPVETGAPQGD